MAKEGEKGKDLPQTLTWEKLIRLVPGLAGYQGREKIREADKILRMTLADRLAAHQGRVEAVKKSLVEGKDFQSLPQLDLLTRKMAQCRDTLAFTQYGYSGVFDLQQVGMTELEGIYQFDLYLAEEVESLGRSVEAFSGKFSQKEKRPEAIRELEKVISEFMERLASRSQALKG